MRQWVAEVDEQAITEILGDMPIIASNHLGAGVLIGPHHLAQLFRVELAGEYGRVHQVTEQHGELAAFRLGGAACDRRWCFLVSLDYWRGKMLRGLRRLCSRASE